jgi:predicted nuclease with RNAse H fold
MARVVEVGTRVFGGGTPNSSVGPNGQGPAASPWYDDVLVEYLARHAETAAVAIDAPLTLPACVRCRLPVCRTLAACDDPAVAWFRGEGRRLLADGNSHAEGRAGGHKPLSTPYTQRATEVVLHKRHGILPRETLGQGMGPLTARVAYLRRALETRYRLNDNLLEVYPKATLTALFGRLARRYKRHPDTWSTRAAMLESLSRELVFDVWREGCLANDHCFDAVVCAYTAYLWAREGWTLPEGDREVFEQDGWIWFPPGA